ncbi:hypothetical protein L484_001899 [Morus notabilis]|uniref:Uncharacterized protein n=1 Tax=Morus notabilis TaxID=981085 RepID=W9RXE9_9ROSA|nr:hypothetical protein L484_001899 [Morus notabilis]
MASQGHEDIANKAGELKGQAQVKKDELVNKASDASQTATDKASSITGSAKENKDRIQSFHIPAIVKD